MYEFQRQRGVATWQFVAVFPLFLLFVLLIVDMSRVSAVKMTVGEAVHRSIEVASTVPNLDTDPRGKLPTDVWYLRMKLAREKSVSAAENWLASVNVVQMGSDAALAGTDGPKLYDLVFTESRIAGAPEQTTTKIAVLMPGECVDVPAIGQRACNRETLGTLSTDPPPAMAPKLLQENHPVKVVAFLSVDSYTPFLFKRPIRIQEFAFREPIPPGPFPADEDPGLNGGVGSPTTAPPLKPLGKPKMPKQPPLGCVPNWTLCVGASANTPGKKYVPAYWLPPEADGTCKCVEASDAT